jgi:hypothetical protein
MLALKEIRRAAPISPSHLTSKDFAHRSVAGGGKSAWEAALGRLAADVKRF